MKPYLPEEDYTLADMTPEEEKVWERLRDSAEEILPPGWHYATIALIPDPNVVRDLISGELPPGRYKMKRGNTATNMEDEDLVLFLETWLRKAKILAARTRAARG